MESVSLLDIEVVCAFPEKQLLCFIKVAPQTTVREAIIQSGILSELTNIDLGSLDVGVYSKPVDLNSRLKSGDRVEIYRPLKKSPVDARRSRAAK